MNQKLKNRKAIRFTLLLFCLISLGLKSQAQNITVTGVVKDEAGETLPGASIIEQGTTNGTASDINGKYSISVPSDAILMFSSLGYKKQTVEVNGRTTIDLNLSEDSELLDEVVVVGYGTQKKSHSIGAIAQVGGDDVAEIQTTRVDEALAGKLAGVRIQNQDGAPGADPKIQIRAANSISGDASPLVVVDGYPITGSLATINSNDIESIEVLKDAASAAIYGSRGANGVILVTTKKGKSNTSGQPSVKYNAYVSRSSKYVRDNEQLLTAGEWADELEEGRASGKYDFSELDPEFVDYKINAFRNSPDVESAEDWLFRTAYSTSHDISVSGNTENVNYRVSAGYLNAEGVAQDQQFQKYNARLNLDAKLSDKFKAGININGFMGNRDIIGHDMRDLLRAYSIHPIYHTEASIAYVQSLDQQAQALGLDPFDDGYRGGDAPFNNSIYTLEPGMTAQDWHYGRSGNGIGGSGDSGPATKLDNTERYQKTFFGNLNTYLNYNIREGLDLQTVFGGDINSTKDYFWRGLESDSRARSTQTRLQQTDVSQSSVLSVTTLNYSKIIEEIHEINAVAGVEFQNFYLRGIALDGRNVPFGYPPTFGILDPADVATTERNETIARRSVFGRISYAYNSRYLASVSLRRDVDSRFGKNNQSEVFPAFSLGWNVHNEEFYKSEVVSDLKLRLSRGTLGTTAFLGAYDALSLLSPQATIFGNGFGVPENLANPDLTWQTNTETNFGLNTGFLNSRFRLAVDYYSSDIKDMLIQLSISEIYGNSTVKLNSGDVKSSGLEFEVGAVVIDKKDFGWDISANLSTVETEITDLGGLDELPQQIYGQSGRGPVFRNYVGGQIGEMWGLETDGMVETQFIEDPTRAVGISSSEYYVKDQQSPGEEGYGEIDNTKTVAEGGDLVKIGQNTPDFYWGFNSQVRYKAFDFMLQLQGSHGADVFNVDEIYWRSEFGGRLRDSFDADGDEIADHNGKHYTQSRNQLDAQIQDASFIAIRNLTVGYTLKPELVKKAGIASARLYIAASNLLYLMANNYTSFNPEGVETTNTDYAGPTTYGVQVGASPVVRSFTFGVNVNF
jgi:TonB-linked SusC/RagA family outer membrane protein